MPDKTIGSEKNILFYNDEEGNIKVEVLLENEDVWLNTEALATLFNIDRSGIVRHINNNLIISLGGYHNEIRKNFLLKLFNFNKNLNFYHSGDIDAGGFYILNHLIKDTNINFIAKYMDINTLIKYKDYTKELTKEDIKRLSYLKEQPIMNKYLDVIDYMLKYNVKLEQENINYP